MSNLIRDWMTIDPITINGDNTLSIAYNLMRINNVRHLPVINDEEKLIGLITWTDVREAKPKLGSQDEQNADWEDHFLAAVREVHNFMTPVPHTLTPDLPIAYAAQLMIEQKVSGLPVVENNRVVGIVTEIDLFRFVVETQPATEDTSQVKQEKSNVPPWFLKQNSEQFYARI